MLPKKQDPAERRLVEQCLAGKPEALKELQRRLLQRAPGAIHRAHKSVKRYVPEDIGAAVLAYLYEHKKKLQAFLHGTKHLDAFLDYHLWYAVKRQAEKDERQWAKRVRVPEAHVPDESLGHLPDELMEELYRLATPKEREYLDWYKKLLAGQRPPCPFPDSYASNLKNRIIDKLREILRRK